MQNTMMLIHTNWNQSKTFKLIPISKDCPYNEAIYDIDQKVLAVISKEKKQTYQMVPKFTEKGDVAYLKQPRDNGKNYAEERRLIDTYYEYYIDDPKDIAAFLNTFLNADAAGTAMNYVNSVTKVPDDQKAL